MSTAPSVKRECEGITTMAIELVSHIYYDGEGVSVVLMNAYPMDHRI